MARYIDIDGEHMIKPFTLCLDMPYRQGWNECLSHILSRKGEDVAPVRHSKWIKCHRLKKRGVSLIFSAEPDYYRCENCGRNELKEEPYCNCGCKMDLN